MRFEAFMATDCSEVFPGILLYENGDVICHP
jgi:hypothetical protein